MLNTVLKKKFMLMAAVAAIAVTAPAYAEEVLGSRDDIIIVNSSDSEAIETTQGVVVEKASEAIQGSVKAEAPETLSKMAEDVAPAAVPSQGTVNAVISVPDNKMSNTTMKAVTTEHVSSKTSNPDASAPSSEEVGVPALPAHVGGDVPPNARPGECYAKVLIPAITESTTERVQVAEEQQVLDRIVPAKYEVRTERVKVKEARQYWKAGSGPITKKNEVTGEILCLVEEPAEYKTFEKRVMVEAEKPVYKTVPAQFENITKTHIVTPEKWEWRRILCETNLGQNNVMQIQRALNAKGYKLNVDGRLGDDTLSAVNSYQIKNGLASRGLTYETLAHMGVSLGGV